MKKILNEYLNLLAQRESRVVLGKKWFNLWLLAAVLTATFLSIAFSNGSMIYLNEKMNDPFTNWVNISNGFGSDKFNEFRDALQDEDIQKHYGFGDVQSDNYFALSLVGAKQRIQYLECRFFERLNSDLVKAILAPDNVINNCAVPDSLLQDETFGFILTIDAIKKLGYKEDNIPAYTDYLAFSRGADSLGVKLIEGEFAPAPVPVIAVVKRLPMNMDLVAARYFLEQYQNNDTYPLNLNNETYQRELIYFVEGDEKEFEKVARSLVPDTLNCDVLEDFRPELLSWKNGKMISVFVGDNSTPTDVFQKVDAAIQTKLPTVKRLYKYDASPFTVAVSQFVSVNFANLDSIRAFEHYAKENFNVQIEMSQVNSKENFNAVSVMANILSMAMMIFSIICIIMFIVNMLQSYFQKVKRNLGTFKAFGMNSNELTHVYVLILLAIVVSAIIIALLFTWFIQLILPLIGIVKDGEFNYLSLWSLNTLVCIVIVVVATWLTVRIVMSRLLKQTPGDLIYDRD